MRRLFRRGRHGQGLARAEEAFHESGYTYRTDRNGDRQSAECVRSCGKTRCSRRKCAEALNAAAQPVSLTGDDENNIWTFRVDAPEEKSPGSPRLAALPKGAARGGPAPLSTIAILKIRLKRKRPKYLAPHSTNRAVARKKLPLRHRGVCCCEVVSRPPNGARVL